MDDMKVLIKPVDLDAQEDQDQEVIAYCDKDCTVNICGVDVKDDEVDDILF